jgi:hypothetical protein
MEDTDVKYSNYQPSECSEIDDELFGADFNAEAQRIDDMPSSFAKYSVFGLTPTVSTDRTNQPAQHNALQHILQLVDDSSHSHRPIREPQGALLSPDHSSAASAPGARTDEEEATSVYSIQPTVNSKSR